VSSALAQQKDSVPGATINGSQSEISPIQENSKKIRAADTINYKDDSIEIEVLPTSQTSSVLERFRTGNEDLANLPSMRNYEIYSSAGIIYSYFVLYLFWMYCTQC
jgi:hypothetical protein